MKLSRNVALLLACTTAFTGAMTGCGSDDAADSPSGSAGDNGNDEKSIQTPAPMPQTDSEAPYLGPQCEEPGGASCTGSASGIACPDGSTNAVEFTCAPGDVCDDGECVGQCEAGATECVGETVSRICTADGKSWVNVPCQEGNLCTEGTCGPSAEPVCVPGEVDCADGTTMRTCNDAGSGWDDAACPGATACEAGECRGTVCTVGATRCDESTFDFPDAVKSSYFFEGSGPFEGVGEPNFYTIYTCVDGESWVASECPSDDESYSACTYSGLNQSEVSRYQGQVRTWMQTFIAIAEFGDEEPEVVLASLPPTPTPPLIPPGSKAECTVVENDCDTEAMYFVPSAYTRTCGEWDDDSREDDWQSFSQCEGFLPYSPVVARNYKCSGMTACGQSEAERGCVATECFPDETQCDENEVQFCEFDMYEPEYSRFIGGQACPNESSPGVCTDVGMSPQREAHCDGVKYEAPQP